MDPSQTDKAALRARMRTLRAELARAGPRAGEIAAADLPMERLPAFAMFSGYHASGSEMNPSALIRRISQTGAMFALPVALAKDQPLIFRAWEADMDLEPDAVGVPSPPASAPELHPDLVICPLLAFDRRGGRLGQGGGHYDRTLANLRALKSVFVLGLAYSGQEVDAVPMGEHDQRLDAVLTETGYFEVKA
ncbi:MAG: 5-formyltetrahydrofolate cyclo-ligase [Phenylobacterium sp.]|uniref:5-formyltetrahydrofolate cyclo-ligase n=1 Tax=Phenylobacterium sp. TaxID=1871053 RepID=UPI002735BFA4|nr:5-formyltetrahydrofolate cyclo-ligase [Phenylobacterium sp.]MDP3173261.1 5-formyltetrahydrofolate cyclo-ligase [Phenylobacterium sp.]